MFMPAEQSGKVYKLAKPFKGLYRIEKVYNNGADVK